MCIRNKIFIEKQGLALSWDLCYIQKNYELPMHTHSLKRRDNTDVTDGHR